MSAAAKSSAMRCRAIALAALLLPTLALPGGARGGHYAAACNGYWQAPASCKFYFRGFPISVYADALVSSGNAEVHLTVTIDGVNGSVILECSQTAPGYVECSRGVLEGVPGNAPLLFGYLLLSCNISGRGGSAPGANYYSCASGSGT